MESDFKGALGIPLLRQKEPGSPITASPARQNMLGLMKIRRSQTTSLRTVAARIFHVSLSNAVILALSNSAPIR
jgi:hypothetical protein